LGVGALALSLALATTPLAADARQDYVDGLRALREGRFAAALERLDRAIAERPREEARARLVGAIPEPYLPHHYRGIALYNLRRCDDALAAWRRSAADGALAKLPAQAAEVAPKIASCEALQRAERDLATARNRGAKPTARSERLAAAIDEAKSGWRVELMPDLAEEAAQVLEESVPPAAAHAAKPTIDGAGVARSEAQPSRSAETEPAPEPLAAVATAPAASAASAAPATAGPAVRQDRSLSFSPVLLRAATAFAAGEYPAVLEVLSSLEPLADRPERDLALLLRAASRHALYRLGGAEDAALLSAARDDVRELRRTAARVRVDSDSFSPAFVEFFVATR
jgi:hypothetical protein